MHTTTPITPTTPTTTPDLTTYRTVHRAVRVAPHRMAAAVAGIEVGDTRRIEAVARYWRGYEAEVVSHHTIEDTVFFPALVELVDDAAAHIERTDADHHRLDELMERCSLGVGDLQRDAGRPVRERLAEALDALARHMDEHLDFEDAVILPLFEQHMSLAQYTALEQRATKSVGIGTQAAFAVPFVVGAADPATFDVLWASAPLPLKVLYRLTRGRHARLAALALGDALHLEPTRMSRMAVAS